MMDPASGKKIGYVQFPRRFDGIDRHDRYANRNTVFFDVSKNVFRPNAAEIEMDLFIYLYI